MQRIKYCFCSNGHEIKQTKIWNRSYAQRADKVNNLLSKRDTNIKMKETQKLCLPFADLAIL